MRFRDFSMIVVILCGAFIGVLLPQAAPYLEPVPYYSLMVSLYISFMSLRFGQLVSSVRNNMLGIVWFLIARHFLIPSVVYILFEIIAPDYALAALLMAGAATAVTAPFIAYLLEADVGFTTVLTVSSSFILPLSLPFIVLYWAGKSIEIPALDMMISLALVILIPTAAVTLTQRYLPKLTNAVQRQGFYWGLTTMFLAILAIFSRYSGYFFTSPAIVWESLAAASAVAIILGALGWLAGYWFSPDVRLTFVISSVLLNLVLVVVLCNEFFGPREAITAVMYTIPFYATVMPLRAYIVSVAKKKNG